MDEKEKRFYQAVKFAPCLACGKPGPSEAAHIKLFASKKTGELMHRSHKGVRKFSAIPLCYECHRGKGGIHDSGDEWHWLETHITGGRERAASWLAHILAALYDEC